MKYVCGLLVFTIVVSMVVAGTTHNMAKRQVPGADQAGAAAQAAAQASGQAADAAKTGIDMAQGGAQQAASAIPGRR
ncbi:hypothetical protein C0J52_06587 [Blattella germanica]|nr:hypothetical protein C0J52_06587 [Blattella germanica]